jgi:hypothetical protein
MQVKGDMYDYYASFDFFKSSLVHKVLFCKLDVLRPVVW